MYFPSPDDATMKCQSPNASPNDVPNTRNVAVPSTNSDSLAPNVCRALDQLAGQQHSCPDEPLFGRKDQLSVNWTTYWDERASCFRLLYVGQPQLQCNSNAKGEVTCKRKHPSGDSNSADDPDSDDDVKLSKAVKLVNIRHVTFAPEFV